MCLAVPMKLIALENSGFGTAELEGVKYRVNVSLLEECKVDDYVIVHAGFAIEKLDQKDADETLAMLEKLSAASTEEP